MKATLSAILVLATTPFIPVPLALGDRHDYEVLPPPVPAPPILAPFAPEAGGIESPGTWPAQQESVAVYRPRITVRHHRLLGRRRLSDRSTHELVLHVTDPLADCIAEIPVCLPVCCTAPTCQITRGIHGRKLILGWECGVRVKIVFRHKGRATVHYYGVGRPTLHGNN